MNRTIKVLAMLIALVAIAAPVMAQKMPANAPVSIKMEKYKLKNGLEVILSEDHRLPLVAVDVWYHVGPANERPGRTGFAHLFEHMMFQGSRHVAANQHFKVLEAAGASDINGTTGFDRTNYFETVPSNQLDTALWLESDRMGYLIDNVTARNLANQRDVVRNERRQGEASPYYLVQEGSLKALFPKGHPYNGMVIGSHADIESVELQDVRDFQQLYYRPNNATVAIVGDFDPKTIKAKVDKYFGPLSAGAPVPKITVTTPQLTAEKRLTITDEVELPRIYIGWHTAPIFQPGDADAEILGRILGGGKSSRLYKKLVYEKQIAQDAEAYNESLMLGSAFAIEATAKPGVSLEDIEKAIFEELTALQQQGPTAAEVERARNKVQTQIISGLERLGGFGGVADRLNYYNHFLGDPNYLAKDLARYDAVTPESVQRIARTLTPDSRVVVYGIKGKKVIEDVAKRVDTAAQQPAPAPVTDKPEEAWRAQAPKPETARQVTLPVPSTFKLNNGLTVMVVEQHNLPIFSARLITLSGSGNNPVEKPGLAAFTATMLQEGTEKRTAPQIADDVDQIGANLSTYASADMSGISTRSLSKNADAAFELLSDVTLHPAFRAADMERIRKQRQTALLQEKSNPSALANKFLYLQLYGAGHPYGYTESGTEQATLATTREDMEKFYRAGYAPQNSALVIAGDVSMAQVRTLAQKYFGGWTGKASLPAPAEVASSQKRRVMIVDRPGAGQTMLRIGQIGVARNTPDYVPLEVMNAALGGLFSSRINLNLREVHGYTYGAFSNFVYRRLPGPFMAGSAVRTDVTAPSVSEVFKEVEQMRNSTLKPEELALAKDSIARSVAADFESTGSTVSAASQLFTYQLPLDYYRTLPAKVDTVTSADVERVAKQYLNPESMVVVAVGDRQKITPELSRLDLGTVDAMDVSGKPIPAAEPAQAGK
jgi:zinc protease